MCARPTTGGSAPPEVHLGIDNSRARGRREQPLARLTFFAAYWIDNRTGVDLLFQDHAAARHLPLLLGARLPYAFAPVLVPGVVFAFGVSSQRYQGF